MKNLFITLTILMMLNMMKDLKNFILINFICILMPLNWSPMMILMLIIFTNLMICMNLYLFMNMNWFSMILFLIMIGAMMILFLYLNSFYNKLNKIDYMYFSKWIDITNILFIIILFSNFKDFMTFKLLMYTNTNKFNLIMMNFINDTKSIFFIILILILLMTMVSMMIFKNNSSLQARFIE